MTSHPRFEEITALVFPTAVNSQYFQLAAQVNAHLCVCQDCRQVYHMLAQTRQQAEELYFGEADRDA